MPSTLPMSRSRGRTVDRTTSTTRLCFSSTTPVRTVKPNENTPTRISTAVMLAIRNWASAPSSGGSIARTVGGACAPASVVGSTPASPRTAFTRSPATAFETMPWIVGSASSWNTSSPAFDRSAGTTTSASTCSAASAVAPASRSG